MFTITNKLAFWCKKIQIFIVLQLKSISLQGFDFSKVLEIFIIQEKPPYKNQVLFIFRNISKTSNFKINCGHSCLPYPTHYFPSKVENNTTGFFIFVRKVPPLETFWAKWSKTAWKLQNHYFWGKTVG